MLLLCIVLRWVQWFAYSKVTNDTNKCLHPLLLRNTQNHNNLFSIRAELHTGLMTHKSTLIKPKAVCRKREEQVEHETQPTLPAYWKQRLVFFKAVSFCHQNIHMSTQMARDVRAWMESVLCNLMSVHRQRSYLRHICTWCFTCFAQALSSSSRQ